MTTWLIDTGPLVAFFDRADSSHPAIKELLNGFQGRLCTTGAVICEVMHFVSREPDLPMKFLEFILSSGLNIFESTRPEQIYAAVELMDKYQDTPMDFADATLVLLADKIGVQDILTLDRRGFRTYRTSKGKPFRLTTD
jgi:predicted nucleic acid-binding protein